MSSTPTPFTFSALDAALLRAVGTPADLEGAAQVLPIIVSCVKAAASLWPIGPLTQWAEVTVEMQRHFSAGKSMANGVPQSLFNQPLRPTKTYVLFTDWRSPPLSIGPAFKAHALLGRAVIQAASAGRVISAELMSGLQTLARARHRDSRGGRSADWDRIIAIHLNGSEELKQALANISPKSPIAGFTAAAISVLDTVCLAPSSIDNHSRSGTEDSPEGQSKENRVPKNTISNDQVNADQIDGDGEGDDGTPDIKTRLRAADFTSFTEKLGLYHRDQMLIGDLVDITKQLVKFLSNGSLREKGFALLAILSLVTGCSDITALQLQFGPLHSIWLDLKRGCWAWDFNVYRRSKGELIAESIVQPIFIAWPSLIDGLLNIAYENNPAAKTLADLILTIQKMDHFDLKGYRQFLRNCGHPSHPPYRGRIAHSAPLVYLEVTGSDMTTTMMTGSPAYAGPAALYYFGLNQQVLQSRITQVYETLALGPPSARNNDSGRVGCQKVLEVEVLRKGWSDLTKKINEARDQARAACDPDDIRDRCNHWMSLLCTAFVIQSAHRATRLECLTAGALYLHNDVALIHDKDEGDRVQPRLVPKTASLQKILQSAAECHQLMRTSSGAARIDEPVFWELNETIFCQWKKSGNGLIQEILKTGDVEAHTRNFFSQSEANFGRSNWVTYLDEDLCNRWLIRSLTGHTRDVTRTHGPYFDVPPLVVASRLGLQMEVTGQRIFGETDISVGANAPPILKLVVSKCQSAGIPDIDRVPDPRTILQPLSIDTLTKWCVSDQIRKDLISGHIDAPSEVLALLHLLFIDQIPFADLCISAVVDGGKVVKQYGQRAGLSWLRSHFIHPTWLPIQPTTYCLLQRINASAVVAKDLIMQVCTTIRQRQYCGWPTSENACWSAIASMGLSFRRLSFPPSIAAVSDLAVPAPCLSGVSLSRLMGEQGNAAHATRAVKPPARARRTEEDAKFLIRTLGKFASTTDRLGEKIMRPKLCLHELESSQIAWSPFVKWVKDWVVDELTRTRQSQPHCYLISSIETYTSTLLTALTQVSLIDDPLDWEDHEWMAWVEQTNKACGGKPSEDDDEKEDVLLTERAKHAIQALVNSLVRRRIYVPYKVHKLLGDSIKVMTPRGSASACLILDGDLAASIAIMKDWYQDSPGDFALADMRVEVSKIVPSRSGEISSFRTDCLTPSGGLVIERAGYAVHKNKNAIRLIPLDGDDVHTLKEKRNVLQSYFGDRPLLLRSDGSHEAGLRDERIASELSAALKLATGDPQAKPYSVRAATLQNIAWPGWQQQFQALASNQAGPKECVTWTIEHAKEYCRLSAAVSMAGQGDLRPAFGHYLAGWPMVFALIVTASLHSLTPGPAFLNQLGISPASLRKARSRAKRPSSAEEQPSLEFGTWNWVISQITQTPRQPVRVKSDASSNPSSVSAEPVPPDPSATELVKLRYLTVRMLGMPFERAIEKTSIPLRLGKEVEKLLPPECQISSATTRSRQGAGERGKAADINTALSNDGLLIISWLNQMQHQSFTGLKEAFFRDEPANTYLSEEKVSFWRGVSEKLPDKLSIHVRIGSKYLSTAEMSAFKQQAPALNLTSDSRIGERPVVSIHERGIDNFVVSARFTAVTRSICLAIDCLRRVSPAGDRDAN